MKRLLSIFGLLALPFGLWFLVQADLTRAEELTDEELQALTAEFEGFHDDLEAMQDQLVCGAAVQAKALPLLAEQQEFYASYFLVDRPASKLIEEAMDFHRFVDYSLTSVYRKYSDPGFFKKIRKKEFTLTEHAAANAFCSEQLEYYVDLSRFMYQKFSMDIAAEKRTYVVVDGLKSMNANLDELYLNYHYTFPGVFTKFDNALPCYAKACVSY